MEIQAEEAGPHNTDLFLRNKEIPTHVEHVKDFPKVINVEPGVDAKATTVEGPGVEREGGVLQDKETFFDITAKDKHGRPVGAKGAGLPFVVAVKGPRGNAIPARVVDQRNGVYHVTYLSPEHGDLRVDVTLKGQNVADAPYTVFCRPAVSAARTTCDGPALKPGNKDGQPTHFVITTKDKDGKPCGVHGAGQPFVTKVVGPTGEVPVQQVDNGDGTVRVDFVPRDHGDHTITVTLEGQHVDRSPYKVVVDPTLDASRSLAHGPGIEDGANRDGEKTHFIVELRDKDGKPVGAKGAGAPLVATVQGPTGPVPVKMTDRRDGTVLFEYTPTDHGDHTVDIALDGAPVANAPYNIRVLPSTNLKVRLPWRGNAAPWTLICVFLSLFRAPLLRAPVCATASLSSTRRTLTSFAMTTRAVASALRPPAKLLPSLFRARAAKFPRRLRTTVMVRTTVCTPLPIAARTLCRSSLAMRTSLSPLTACASTAVSTPRRPSATDPDCPRTR